MTYNYRYLQQTLEVRPTGFRAVLITGPRRAGKSTFAQHLLELWGGRSYVSFDTPLEQARFKSDPVGFLSSLRTPAVLDEVQNVPEIFNYLKAEIDKNPEAGCDYILTGSQHFQMMHRVSESLAGRILIKELLPFSLGEAQESEVSRIRSNVTKILELSPDLEVGERAKELFDRDNVINLLSQGGFPPSVLRGPKERPEWFNSYVETYVQRDVRALSNVQDLGTFSRFVSLVAGRTAKIINYSELGKDLGINYKTTQHYLSLLETSYLWKSLAPYYKAGSEKRLSKSPKGVFADTGLAMFLTGLHPDGLDRNPLYGSLFESLVVNEFTKLLAAFGQRVALCHFRAGESAEVDLVLEVGSTIVPIEVKCSASAAPSWGKGIEVLRKVAGLPADHTGYVISLFPEIRELRPGIWNLPLSVLF